MKSNVGPVFDLDEETYTVKVDGLVKKNLEFTLKDLRETFDHLEVVAALQVR